MKKTSFLVILSIFLINITLKAQTEKGKILLGGTINPKFYSSKNTHQVSNYYNPSALPAPYEIKINSLNISSNVKGGYFLFKNLALGLNINENFNQFKYSNSTVKYKSFILSGGPFLRVYPIRKESLGIFLESGGNLGFGKISSNNKIFSMNAYAGPGINYFITEKVGIELSLFYSYSKEENKYTRPYVLEHSDVPQNFTEKKTSNIHEINAMVGINLFL